MGGRPSDSGVSRIRMNATTATASAITAGNQKAARQSSAVQDSAQAAATPRPAAPTLWAVFQMEVFQPRSLVENQWTRMRPEAGQPMPWNQPLMNMTVAKTAMVPETHGTKATTRLVSAERARPIGRKSRALERSEIVAMKNFERP